jgi:hypothetical protein
MAELDVGELLLSGFDQFSVHIVPNCQTRFQDFDNLLRDESATASDIRVCHARWRDSQNLGNDLPHT